jgi:hypothetical protein
MAWCLVKHRDNFTFYHYLCIWFVPWNTKKSRHCDEVCYWLIALSPRMITSRYLSQHVPDVYILDLLRFREKATWMCALVQSEVVIYI